jgi:hypothetical protein
MAQIKTQSADPKTPSHSQKATFLSIDRGNLPYQITSCVPLRRLPQIKRAAINSTPVPPDSSYAVEKN